MLALPLVLAVVGGGLMASALGGWLEPSAPGTARGKKTPRASDYEVIVEGWGSCPYFRMAEDLARKHFEDVRVVDHKTSDRFRIAMRGSGWSSSPYVRIYVGSSVMARGGYDELEEFVNSM